MRKKLAVCLLILTAIIFIASSVDDITRMIAQARYRPVAWWGSDKYKYGDLYGMCYLPQFRMSGAKQVDLKEVDSATADKKINLYGLSDSYTWSAFSNPKLFYNVSKSQYVQSNTNDVLQVTLDKSKKNVLILESTERNVRVLFGNSSYLENCIHFKDPNEDITHLKTAAARQRFRFNFKIKDIDPNIEFNAWDYHFLTPIKELRAWINYKWFNRTNPDVYVSEDEKYLLYNQTIDTVYKQSAFKSVSEKEINKIVSSLNTAADYYKSKGFDEVYLAMIPNPVTMLYPNYHGFKYNNLIPLIQTNKALKLKVIDSYAAFKNNTTKLYEHADTHWNHTGEQVWLDLVNTTLGDDKSFK